MSASELKTSVMERIKSIRYENPVVTKELRTRMRGGKAHTLMAAYVFLMGFVIFTIYFSSIIGGRVITAQAWSNMRLGATMFYGLTMTQAILIALIAPSLSASAITMEKEQQTLEVLSLTMMSARNIIAGKIASAMLFILMLLACSLPLASICLMFGSLSPLEIVVTYLMLVAWGFLFCSLGVLVSSMQKKTASATTLSLLLVGFYGVLTSIYIIDLSYRNVEYIFAGLSGCTASKYALASAKVFSLNIPVALVGIVFNVGLGLLALTTTITKIPYHRIEKPGLIRGLLLGLSLTGFFLLYGDAMRQSSAWVGISGDLRAFFEFAFSMMLIAISPFIAVFSTGPVGRKPRENGKIKVLGTVQRLFFDNRPMSGLRFMTLWSVLAMGIIFLSLYLGHTTLKIYNPTHAQWTMLWQASLAIVASIVGMCALGIMMSTLLTNRILAIAVNIILIAVAWVAFPIMWSGHEASSGFLSWKQETSVFWQIAYFWPGLTISKLTSSWRQGVSAPNLALSAKYLWIACTIAWSAVAAGALAIAKQRSKKPCGIVEDWPE